MGGITRIDHRAPSDRNAMQALADFLRSHREEIIQTWVSATAQLPVARALSRAHRRNHIPQLIDAMVDAIERGDRTSVSLAQIPLIHVDERWTQNYDLRDVVAEYRLLRRVILDMYAREITSENAGERVLPIVTLNENLDHAITDAVDHFSAQRERTREYFMGILGHDLREPLHVIAMNAALLLRREEPLPNADLRQVARIASGAARMERLISDLLDVTRSRLGGGLPMTPVDTDLGRIAGEIVDDLSSANPGRDIRCSVEASERGVTGHWDSARLTQLVSNLIANALKHGGDPIEVTVRPGADDTIVLEVRNRGEILPHLRDHLFEPFFTSDQRSGIGLGLYIAREIANAHAGELELVDAEGETLFRLTLPRPDAAADAETPGA
jgi:signal transduction histidine kinase